MAFIYTRDKTMTKQTCDVGSYGGTFQVALEYWRTKQVRERKPVLAGTTDGKREKRRYTGDCNIIYEVFSLPSPLACSSPLKHPDTPSLTLDLALAVCNLCSPLKC